MRSHQVNRWSYDVCVSVCVCVCLCVVGKLCVGGEGVETRVAQKRQACAFEWPGQRFTTFTTPSAEGSVSLSLSLSPAAETHTETHTETRKRGVCVCVCVCVCGAQQPPVVVKQPARVRSRTSMSYYEDRRRGFCRWVLGLSLSLFRSAGWGGPAVATAHQLS